MRWPHSDAAMHILSPDSVFMVTDNRLAGIAGYLSSGVLLHAITVIELVAVLAVAGGEPDPLKAPALVLLGLYMLFTQLDARSRYQEYKRVRDQLIRHGPDPRIFRSIAASRCQRDAGLAAAKGLGHEMACRGHFQSMGYRWYHLLPDFVMRQPLVLLSPAFLRTTFFLPGYTSRYPAGIQIDPPNPILGSRQGGVS